MALPESGLLTASVSWPSAIDSFTARPRSDEMVETRSTARGEALAVDDQLLVVAGRDDALVVREGAVDQLGGQHDAADGEADLGVRHLDGDGDIRIVDQLLQFADGLARDDDARHALGAGRRLHFGARQAVAVGRDRAQLELAADLDACGGRCR